MLVRLRKNQIIISHMGGLSVNKAMQFPMHPASIRNVFANRVYEQNSVSFSVCTLMIVYYTTAKWCKLPWLPWNKTL